ncbi:glycosyltransferase family protein [Segnochrobactraceae bacterium EtOH-i3]
MPANRPRILIYSHDSFGLGHLRRCRAIAHALVGRFDDMSVLILSGSPIIGSFDFRARVDFVRVPGVIKLRNGDYTSLSLHIDTEQTLQIRASIIEHTAQVFDPDIFIVDKEPLGLRGEVRPTLERLAGTRTRCILGLRDVMDDPDTLRDEWARKGAPEALADLYHEIWLYGLPEIHDPLAGIDLPDSVRAKEVFTGYLKREIPCPLPAVTPPFGGRPYILVTPGGGGDGVELVDWVLRAYEARSHRLLPCLIVMGPFMDSASQAAFQARVDALEDVEQIRFTPTIEPLMQGAAAIVGMGGYNIFCEILSFDRPTLLVPRVMPRMEQAIRAARAEEVGLVRVLPIDHYPDVAAMAEALEALPDAPPPSRAGVKHLLSGLDTIGDRVEDILSRRRPAPRLQAI